MTSVELRETLLQIISAGGKQVDVHMGQKEILIVLIIALLIPGVVSAANEEKHEEAKETMAFDISVGTELMSGDTTYAIGGPVTSPNGEPVGQSVQHFPFSELEWPLDMWLARIDASVHIGSSWRINAKLKKNINDPNGSLLDSDWIIPGSLDVYSESNISDFDAVILDLDIEWAFLQSPSWRMFAGVGYQYQDFSYESQLIHQFSPSGLFPELNLYGDGRMTVAYEISYKMPYFLVGTEFYVTPGFSIAGNFSYSPLVEAEDEDTHLATNKTGVGDMEGDAFMLHVSGEFNFKTSWFLEAGFHYTLIEVNGDQQQLFQGVRTYTVHEKSESEQRSAYLTLGYRF